MVGRQVARPQRNNRRRSATALLAAVALLLVQLLPPALFAAPDPAAQLAAAGFCGVPHAPASKPEPAKPVVGHCVYCFIVAPLAMPPAPAVATAPRLAARPAAARVPAASASRLAAFTVAQPRGPPIVLPSA